VAPFVGEADLGPLFSESLRAPCQRDVANVTVGPNVRPDLTPTPSVFGTSNGENKPVGFLSHQATRRLLPVCRFDDFLEKGDNEMGKYRNLKEAFWGAAMISDVRA
jgi:hypothetical protein